MHVLILQVFISVVHDDFQYVILKKHLNKLLQNGNNFQPTVTRLLWFFKQQHNLSISDTLTKKVTLNMLQSWILNWNDRSVVTQSVIIRNVFLWVLLLFKAMFSSPFPSDIHPFELIGIHYCPRPPSVWHTGWKIQIYKDRNVVNFRMASSTVPQKVQHRNRTNWSHALNTYIFSLIQMSLQQGMT